MALALSSEEKNRILRALEENREFRLAIAGLIGMRKLLEKLDRTDRNMEKIWGEIRKLWEEVMELRLGQEKLWGEVKGLRLNFEQLGRAVGMTLEHYTAASLKMLLVERVPGGEAWDPGWCED